MSLLNRFNATVMVFPEIETTDRDGNIITKPSDVGIETKATIQLAAQSGTSSRRAEQDTFGFFTEEMYRIRFPKGFQELGSESAVEWQGRRYTLFGKPQRFLGSSRTARLEYFLIRN